MKNNLNSVQTIGDRIKQIRKMKGLKQKEFANFIGLNNIVSLSRYENNTTKQNISILLNISKKCNVSLNWIITGKGEMYKRRKFSESCPKYKIEGKIPCKIPGEIPCKIPVRPVPVLNTIPAGFPETPIEDNIIDWIFIPMDLKDPKAFALIITGKSMYPKIDDGEIVVISPKTEVTSGQIGAFRINNDVAIKRLLIKDGETYLMSENPEHLPIKLKSGDKLETIGLAVYQVKKIQ